MERLLWLLLVCGVAGGANWYYPQKYGPQVEAAQRASRDAEHRSEELSGQLAEKDRSIAELQGKADALGKKVDEGLMALMQAGEKTSALRADYETKIQSLMPKPPPQPVVPDVPNVSAPHAQAPAQSPPTSFPLEKKGPSDFDLKQITDLKADIAAAQERLKVATDELQKWDAGAYVDDNGILRGARPVHKTSTNAPGEINDARARIRKDEAELIGLQGPGG